MVSYKQNFWLTEDLYLLQTVLNYIWWWSICECVGACMRLQRALWCDYVWYLFLYVRAVGRIWIESATDMSSRFIWHRGPCHRQFFGANTHSRRTKSQAKAFVSFLSPLIFFCIWWLHQLDLWVRTLHFDCVPNYIPYGILVITTDWS